MGTAVRIALDPEDWFRAPWRSLEPLPRPAPRPFNREAALARLAALPVSPNVRQYEWDQGRRWKWDQAGIDGPVSPEEGVFWLSAMTEASLMTANGGLCAWPRKRNRSGTWERRGLWTSPQLVAAEMAASAPKGRVTQAQINSILGGQYQEMDALSVLLLLSLFSVTELIGCLLEAEEAQWQEHGDGGLALRCYRGYEGLLEGFGRWARPYMTGAEVQEVRQFLRPRLDSSLWSVKYTTPRSVRLVFAFAALFGMSDELQPLVESWPSTLQSRHSYYATEHSRPLRIVFGLGSGPEVEAQVRRMNLLIGVPQDVRAWLAHTEVGALEEVQKGILDVTSKEEAEALIQVLAQVEAPEAAPVMLALRESSRVPHCAWQWLETHTAHAVTGLLPLAGGNGPLAEPATEFLRGVRRRGQAALIESGLASFSPEAAARVRCEVLSGDDPVPFDDTTTPNWLREAQQKRPKQKEPKSEAWLKPEDLPFITIGPHCLNEVQTALLMQALEAQKALSRPPHPLVAAVKAYADPASLDLFAGWLFERWRMGAAPASWGRWLLPALGLLGGDKSARKLTPLIQVWPGEAQHSRAVLGLEALRAIGTDTAVRQISLIAQNTQFKGLKTKADACLNRIASKRTLSRAELELSLQLTEGD